MVKQARARITRDAIVAGAAEVFRRRGYGSASVAEIAAESGMTKGALYFHFVSKDDLARAVIEEQHRRTMTAVAATLEEGRPALETMVVLCLGLAEQLQADRVVQAGVRLTTDVSTFEQPVADPYRDWMRTLAELTRRGIAEGDLRPEVDPETFARFLSPAFTGVQLVSETLTDHADLLQRVRELWAFVLPGIVATGRAKALQGLPESVGVSR
ncbi:ScbR family autoregulator-binding transcription factor [Leifsonia sp. F6_8S_P_1B]|uniref:ScbR family autoregulator-binding transcription factor n=1 Tax=Leifsonia williamsii TaxID=3035919 RepID=A0ABT8KFP8_9MICO|nr:ScbR family autoregulator-binding transcription factor [Leifsonia williamsii]MDN4616279.1 ScbR family autoregulator-binding transcription factor [Leifsonia williamsii]